jgi:hypothetical protein
MSWKGTIMATLTQIGLTQIGWQLKGGGYVCELYSCPDSTHGTVYGFVVYTADADIEQLVCFDFGYTSVGEVECVALAYMLRVTAEVTVEDFTTVSNGRPRKE